MSSISSLHRPSDLRPGDTVNHPGFKAPLTVAGISLPKNGSAYCTLTFKEDRCIVQFIPLADGDEAVWERCPASHTPTDLDAEIADLERQFKAVDQLVRAGMRDRDDLWRVMTERYARKFAVQAT